MNLNQMMKIQIRINLMRWLVFLFLLLKVRKLSLSVFLVSLLNHASFSWMSQVIFEEVQMRTFCVDFLANKTLPAEYACMKSIHIFFIYNFTSNPKKLFKHSFSFTGRPNNLSRWSFCTNMIQKQWQCVETQFLFFVRN